jgi:hypothetical protein
MDTKITLSFDEDVIAKAKRFADSHNMSLSRLTEFLYSKLTKNNYATLEDLPLSDWVNMVAEGPAEYVTKRKSSKQQKDEFYESRKRK